VTGRDVLSVVVVCTFCLTDTAVCCLMSGTEATTWWGMWAHRELWEMGCRGAVWWGGAMSEGERQGGVSLPQREGRVIELRWRQLTEDKELSA